MLLVLTLPLLACLVCSGPALTAHLLSRPQSQVQEHICKLAKKGMTPSQIGVILRDSHGIAQVGAVTGSKVLRILKGSGELPSLSPFFHPSCMPENMSPSSRPVLPVSGQALRPRSPEDLYFLIKKAVSMRKHMDRNRKDKDTKFRLILVESRIHRLARYYKVPPPLLPLSFFFERKTEML